MDRYIIVIPANEKDYVNNKVKEDTFRVGISKNGEKPITHYWCNWNMTKEIFKEVQEKLGDIADFYNADEYSPDDVLQEKGLMRIESKEG